MTGGVGGTAPLWAQTMIVGWAVGMTSHALSLWLWETVAGE